MKHLVVFLALLLCFSISYAGLSEGVKAINEEEYIVGYNSLIAEGKNGNRVAQYYLSIACRGLDRLEESLSWVVKSAKQGYPLAIVDIAKSYLHQAPYEIGSDLLKAHNLFVAVLNQKEDPAASAIAASELGDMYVNGWGVKTDIQTAKRYYHQGIKSDPSNGDLMWKLFEIYKIYLKDDKKAAYWFKKSLEAKYAWTELALEGCRRSRKNFPWEEDKFCDDLIRYAH